MPFVGGKFMEKTPETLYDLFHFLGCKVLADHSSAHLIIYFN